MLFYPKVAETGDPGISSTLLEGHLSITRELVMFLPPDRKADVGSGSKGSVGLVRELVEDWIFPASKLWVSYNQGGGRGKKVGGREKEVRGKEDLC